MRPSAMPRQRPCPAERLRAAMDERKVLRTRLLDVEDRIVLLTSEASRPAPMPSSIRTGYRVSEIVSLTGLGQTFVRDEIAKGRLPARKAGSVVLVRAEDLVTYIENLPSVAGNE